MNHRNLIEEDYSGMAIDDIISRGLWIDWLELDDQVRIDNSTLDIIEHICNHYINDPYAQRYHFWLNYVKKKRQTG
jgi:hypothetical protein